MKSNAEIYIDYIEDLAGGNGKFIKITDENEKPSLFVISYADMPEEGIITAFTYGLSSTDHPAWQHGRPELVISVNSDNPDWAASAGFIAKRFRGTCPFSYGNTIKFGSKITEDSNMSAFFVFAPSILSEEQKHIKLNDTNINIVQIYPIYEEEIELIKRTGPTEFFMDERINFSDTKRPNFGL